MRSRLTGLDRDCFTLRRRLRDHPELSTEPPEDTQFSEKPAEHGSILIEIEPRTFSFNTPHGACPTCQGSAAAKKLTDLLIPDKKPLIA